MTPAERAAQRRGHPDVAAEKQRKRESYALNGRAAYQRKVYARAQAADESGLAGIRTKDGAPLVAIVVSDPGSYPFSAGAVLSHVTETLRLGSFNDGTVLNLHGHLRIVRGETGKRQRLERYGG